MQYDVYLDDIFFYGVTDFSFSGDRELVVYNGIGLGYFPKADDPNLRTWSWTCELQERAEHYHDNNFRKASEIFQLLENLKSSKDPSRLVVKGESKSLSEQVLLEGYTYKELYNGVYQVAVNVTEYKEAAVRTTTIPEIPRPGKIPVEQVIEVQDDETAYDKVPEAEESWSDSSDTNTMHGTVHDPVNGVYIDVATGQETTDIVDPDGDKQLVWVGDRNEHTYINNITGEAVTAGELHIDWGGVKDWLFGDSQLGQALDAISDGYDSFAEHMGWRDGWDKPGQA